MWMKRQLPSGIRPSASTEVGACTMTGSSGWKAR